MDLALKEEDNTYLHLITGQDCLCRPISEFNSFFCKNNEHNYMECTDESCYDFRRRVYYRNDWINFKSRSGRLLTEALYVLQRCVGIHRKCPNRFKPYKGLVYVSITRAFATWVMAFLPTVQGERFLKWTLWNFVPEEFFFQTLLMNSPFASTCVKSNYRYASWEEKYGSKPRILDEEDFEQVRMSHAFFARKISALYSRQFLSLVQERNV